jgi:glycosyltransferase involved in cell wall biosynthesis
MRYRRGRGATNVLCFSAFSINLRASAIADQLEALGFTVRRSVRHGRSGTARELMFSLLPNCWLALTAPADLAVGFKPHPNVTLPLMICRARRIPTWIDVDDLDYAYRRGIVAVFAAAMQQPFPRRCDIVTYHHVLLADYLVTQCRCDKQRLVRLAQGVDVELFAEATTASPRSDRPTAVVAGHLNGANDIESILRAWQLVVDRSPRALLLIVGSGPRLHRLEKLARRLGLRGGVQFVGGVQRVEVAQYIARADAALLYVADQPFNRYRCSLKLREYLAAGAEVVCTNVGELREFDEVTHQTDPTPEAFARMTERVFAGFEPSLAAAARRFARCELDWPHIVECALDEIFERLGDQVQPLGIARRAR